jgi:hypothetical protein
MDKEFIPYEQALALKELGFNSRTFAAYNTIQGDKWILTPDLSGEGQYPKSTSACIAPTFSQAFRFFREKYTDVLVKDYGLIPHFTMIQNMFLDSNKIWTYEEAELECLKKLIEIVKQK